MNSRLDIAIVADDLTGAADAGVQFCPYLGPIYMTGGKLPDLKSVEIQARGIAVFTNTRNIPPTQAAERVFRVARIIQELNPRIVYKKIDSSLRGNLGQELDAMVSALQATASFVSPALPEQGRTTVNDCHQINGIPISETEVGQDPQSPVNESQLSVLLAGQSRMVVGHVHLSVLEEGSDTLFEQVNKLHLKGCRHIVFDAQETRHLDAIAALARDRFENILLVGSAGLASSLAKVVTSNPVPGIIPERPSLKKWLFVCGSASKVLAGQLNRLTQSTGWPQVTIAPGVLTAERTSPQRISLLSRLETSWRTSSLILNIASSSDTEARENPDQIVQGLTDVVSFILSLAAPDSIFLSGGDTAEKVMHQINGSAILVYEEILPGLMCGKIADGPFKGLPVFTKPGAFGHPELLIELLHSLTAGK